MNNGVFPSDFGPSCLPLSNEIANPFNGKIEDIPEDMWKTCNATGMMIARIEGLSLTS